MRHCIGASDFNGDVSSWDTSGATDMRNMFQDAANFDGGISDWDVSKVTDMSSMFNRASDFNRPLNGWDVSKVTDMSSMFGDADSFNQPLNGWNVLSVTDMSFMFSDTAFFDGDLTGWDVSKVTDMTSMFDRASDFNRPLDSWDVSSVNEMNSMFHNADSFNQPLNSWNVSAVTDMYAMFSNTDSFNGDISGWDVSKVTDMSLMFSGASFNGDISGWDVSKVTNMSSMFSDVFFEQNLGKWYVTLDPDTIANTGIPGVVGTISAQNQPLKNHSPTYVIVDGLDKNHFEIISGNRLNMTSGVSGKAEYSVNVTAFGMDVFSSGNNWRVLVVKVSSDINAPPVLNTIGDQTVNEFVELAFTATASDDDALTFSLDGTVPPGAAITDDGNFTWTPTELQDGDHTITVQVTDGSLTDSETLTVTVNEVNVAPVLNAIGDKGTSELVELTFPATASDTDVVDNVVNTLTFSLDGTVPPGAAITSAGVFTWTPTESQVGSHDITVQVTDGSLTDSETLTVTVRDVNVAPVLNTIGEQTVNEFVELTFTATASDDDALTFSLDGTVPPGAAITDDGNFTWTPTELQDGDHTITVQVTDGSLTDSETLTVTVNEVNVAPVLNAIGDKGTSKLVELTFPATASDTDVVDNVVNTLTFSLDGTVPPGAAITSAGVFTWTPTESQVGSHDITVQVTDGSLTDSETLTVTVRDVNVAPVLNTIGDQTVNEFVELTFTATASDDDALTFSLDGTVPPGAAITDDGNFTWIPTELQDGDHTITVQVTDGSLTDSETLTVTVNEVNVAPVLNAIGDKGTSELVELTFPATASDTDVVDNVVNTLTFSLDGTVPPGAAITSAGVFTWTPTESQVGSHDITVQVTDGSLTDSETLTVTVRDVNVAPVLNTIEPKDVDELVLLEFNAMATDADNDTLMFSLVGTVPEGASMTPDGAFSWTPDQSQDGDYSITVQVSDGRGGTASEVVDITVHDIAPLPVSARASSSFAIALTLSEVVTSGEQGPNGFSVTTGGDPVLVESITGSDTATLTLNLDGTVSATDGAVRLSYDAAGDVADENGNPLASFSELDVLFSSQRRGGTTPPAVDLGTLAYQRLVDIPPHISEQIASRDDSNPLEPITPDGTFDLPLVINGYGYLLDDVTNTLVPQILTVGDDDPTIITFTVYTQKDLAHFTLYLNLKEDNTDYANSDTYITYKDDGTTSVTDPHGYIGSATITVTQEDDSVPEKKTVSITIEFGEEPMGSTNMVAYMWDTDRKATFIKIIDALEVTAAAVLLEPEVHAADPEPLEPDSELPADPEPVTPDFADDAADPEPISSDTLWSDDYDEAQVLHIIRMWSGFESEIITDTQLLELLGLEDYQDVDLPDWMMTQLGVLVAKGDVTVGEFVVALTYVLERS